jgi:HK97 family phage prohead protease
MKTKIELPPIERRYTSGQVELRSEGEGKPTKVRGYAAMYGKRSANLGNDSYQFYEIIDKGAFDDVLQDDVRALFNHDANLILARSKSKTLTVGVDEVGLWYEFEAPDTQAGRDLKVSMQRGDVDQSSFAFSLTRDGQVWEEKAEGQKVIYTRTIKKVSRLYDVSPVTYPAYPDTSVAMRSLEEIRSAPELPPITPPAEPISHNSTSLLGALVAFF